MNVLKVVGCSMVLFACLCQGKQAEELSCSEI